MGGNCFFRCQSIVPVNLDSSKGIAAKIKAMLAQNVAAPNM